MKKLMYFFSNMRIVIFSWVQGYFFSHVCLLFIWKVWKCVCIAERLKNCTLVQCIFPFWIIDRVWWKIEFHTKGCSLTTPMRKKKSLTKRFTRHGDNEAARRRFLWCELYLREFSRLGSDMSTVQKEKSLEWPRVGSSGTGSDDSSDWSRNPSDGRDHACWDNDTARRQFLCFLPRGPNTPQGLSKLGVGFKYLDS